MGAGRLRVKSLVELGSLKMGVGSRLNTDHEHRRERIKEQLRLS